MCHKLVAEEEWERKATEVAVVVAKTSQHLLEETRAMAGDQDQGDEDDHDQDEAVHLDQGEEQNQGEHGKQDDCDHVWVGTNDDEDVHYNQGQFEEQLHGSHHGHYDYNFYHCDFFASCYSL